MNPARAHLRLKALPSMVGWSPAHITYALIWAIVDLAVSMLTPATGPEAPEASRSDDWAELTPGLKCAVCHEVMHRPCALMPCMHSFCAGCVAETIKWSDACPMCRAMIQDTAPNHSMQFVVDTFLRCSTVLQRA